MHVLILFLFLAPKPDVHSCPVEVTSARVHWAQNAVNIKFKNTGERVIKATAFNIDMIDATNDVHHYPGKLTVAHKIKPGKDADSWFPIYLPNFKAQSFNGVKAYPIKLVFDDGSDMVCK